MKKYKVNMGVSYTSIWLISLLWLSILIHITHCFGRSEEVKYVKDSEVIKSRLNILGKKYLKSENQTWILDAVDGNWALVFDRMDIEVSEGCKFDHLQIKENDPSVPMVLYCGDIVPLPYISETSRLELTFVTDPIWERTGFQLTAYHAPNKDILEARINHNFPLDVATMAYKSPEEPEGMEVPMFFILLGSAGAALILFGILLIYFLTLIRKRPRSLVREPDIYFSSSVSDSSGSSAGTGSGSFVRLLSDKRRQQTPQQMCKSGKKRYSKDKKDGQHVIMAFQNDGHDISTLQNSRVAPMRSHHNTTYYFDE